MGSRTFPKSEEPKRNPIIKNKIPISTPVDLRRAPPVVLITTYKYIRNINAKKIGNAIKIIVCGIVVGMICVVEIIDNPKMTIPITVKTYRVFIKYRSIL